VFKKEPIGAVAFLSGVFIDTESSETIIAFRKTIDGAH
jgi:hypothetical protein